MNKRTVRFTEEQYREVVETIRDGFTYQGKEHRPNDRIATIIVLEGTLGLRLSDILTLCLNSFQKIDDSIFLNIKEKKTGKYQRRSVPTAVYNYILEYALRKGITNKETPLFQIGARAVQKHLRIVLEYLNYENYDLMGTHSARKMMATQAYYNSDRDIVLVQKLLNHSSVAITQRYINIEPEKMTDVLEKTVANLL